MCIPIYLNKDFKICKLHMESTRSVIASPSRGRFFLPWTSEMLLSSLISLPWTRNLSFVALPLNLFTAPGVLMKVLALIPTFLCSQGIHIGG